MDDIPTIEQLIEQLGRPRNPAEMALIGQMRRLPGLDRAAEWIEANAIATAICCFRDHLAALEKQLKGYAWLAISRDALARGDRALADLMLSHARDVEELETIASAAADVYADHSDERAWTDLFEALAAAGRLQGQADAET